LLQVRRFFCVDKNGCMHDKVQPEQAVSKEPRKACRRWSYRFSCTGARKSLQGQRSDRTAVPRVVALSPSLFSTPRSTWWIRNGILDLIRVEQCCTDLRYRTCCFRFSNEAEEARLRASAWRKRRVIYRIGVVHTGQDLDHLSTLGRHAGSARNRADRHRLGRVGEGGFPPTVIRPGHCGQGSNGRVHDYADHVPPLGTYLGMLRRARVRPSATRAPRRPGPVARLSRLVLG
jgi:hypothetical protein